MTDRTRNNKLVLVIDDEPMLRKVVGRILGEEGYDVCHAADGVQGLALLREAKPDLVLLDVRMPGIDGHSTLDQIRQESEVPVIMVSAAYDLDSVRKALALGADGYIRKPFGVKELVARVQSKLRDLPETPIRD